MFSAYSKNKSSIIAILISGCVLSTGLKAETLSEALRSVNTNNPKLQSDRHRHEGELEKIPQARSGFLPQISASADANKQINRNLINNGTLQTTPRGAGVGFSQPLFNGYRTMGEYQRAQDEVLASKANYINAEQLGYLNGAQAYLRVLRDRKVVALRRENLSSLREQQNIAQTRFKAGDMTLTNVDQTKVRVAEADADLAQSIADLADSESYYRYVIGRSPKNLAMPALHKVNLPCSVKDAVDVALIHNPQVQAALHIERSTDGIIKATKASRYPQLSLDGSYRVGMDESKVPGSKADEAQLGVKMSMPIYSGGLYESRIRQAEALKDQRTQELYDIKNNAVRAVSSTWETLKGSRLRKSAAFKRVAASNAALYGLNLEFKAGQVPMVNVLDGRRELANSKVSQVVSEFDEGMQVFNLLASLGQLDLFAVDAITAGKGLNSSIACSKGMALGSKSKGLTPHFTASSTKTNNSTEIASNKVKIIGSLDNKNINSEANTEISTASIATENNAQKVKILGNLNASPKESVIAAPQKESEKAKITSVTAPSETPHSTSEGAISFFAKKLKSVSNE